MGIIKKYTLHSTPLGIHLFRLNFYHFSSYIVYRCQDIYKSNKADGHIFIVTLTTAVEYSELVRFSHFHTLYVLVIDCYAWDIAGGRQIQAM